MKFDNPQTVSFKAVPDGDYVGVLIGFAYVGMHDTRDWGPKGKCMLRWELHHLDAPHKICVDDDGNKHVVTQNFPATIRGDSSWLKKCLIAHGIATPAGGCADSKDWYGKAAKLKIEGSPGRDRIFMNVAEINALDQEVNIQPVLAFEHWEPEDSAPPPIWAKYMIEKSRDLYQRVASAGSNQAQSQARPAATSPSNPSSSYRPAPSGEYRPHDSVDEDDIPF